MFIPDVPFGYCEYKVFYYSNAMLDFIEEQVYHTKTPVIHSSLLNKSLDQ